MVHYKLVLQDLTATINSHLFDALWWTWNRVIKAIVLVDDFPEFSKRAVLLQRVGAFSMEIFVHGWVSHCPIGKVHLFGKVLEWPYLGAKEKSI